MAAATPPRNLSLMRELESMISQFKMYENKQNQAAALSQVPHEFLLAVAKAKFDSSLRTADANNTIHGDLVVRDMFLLELMTWFKSDFFSWMDAPLCPTCSKATIPLGSGTPTAEELANLAGRVETFTCRSCFSDEREVARFPRYNNPVVLLKTRTGRCGEWANCFALICRAVGFEVRYCRDWTDHVWVEIFSNSLKVNRWVHADPCENSYDNPLLYEVGWGKKLSYVFAVSNDDIQDVTWRYTSYKNISQVLLRRRLCDERSVVEIIMKLRQRLQVGGCVARQEVVSQRIIQELSEFLGPRDQEGVKESEKVSRDSGSLAWRLARQELGSGVVENSPEGFQWEITRDKIIDSKFSIQYDCALDQYTAGRNTFKLGWRSGTYNSENIYRKEESDWKMVYLAREGRAQTKGLISWKFVVNDAKISIKTANISILAKSFHSSAVIRITLLNDMNLRLTLNESNTNTNDNFYWQSVASNSQGFFPTKTLTLICELEGGEGDQSWQHAQLFRQPMQNNREFKKMIGLLIIMEVEQRE